MLLPNRPWSGVVGLGSIFGKTLRDSRRAALIVGGIAGLFMLGTGAPFGSAPEFATIELRRQFTQGILSLPLALRGLLGDPIDIEHMGGFLSWRIGNTLPSIFGLWSVIALSGTLAGEAGKGSLDLLLSTPQGRASVALQKLAGHVVAVAVAMAIFAAPHVPRRQVFARLPGDQIPLGAAIGQGVLFGLLMLASGSIAFATAPFVGRTRALAFGLDLAVRRDHHQRLFVAVAADRNAAAALVRGVDRRPSPAGRGDRLAVGRVARRGHGGHSWPSACRVRPARHRGCLGAALAPVAVAAGRGRRPVPPPARRSDRGGARAGASGSACTPR